MLSDCLLLSSACHLPYPFWCFADFYCISRVLTKVCGSLTSMVMVSNEDLSLICKNLLGLSCEATDRVLDVCLYILQSSNQLYKVSFI